MTRHGLEQRLHESTVGVALGSHIAERKRVRADGVRNSVFLRRPSIDSNVRCYDIGRL